MLRKFLEARALKSAARQYAQRLGGQLQKDYGRSDQYTPKQIAASASRAKLPLKYIHLGYAAFLEETAFTGLNNIEGGYSYQELRAMFYSYVAKRSASAFEPLAENAYAIDGTTGRPGDTPF